MTATSVTGRGPGSADKMTATEFESLANGPQLVLAGTTSSVSNFTSPPSFSNTVVFPYPLKGGRDNYAVMLTGVNTGFSYVTARNQDSAGNFVSFTFASESDGVMMYTVTRIGVRPNIR